MIINHRYRFLFYHVPKTAGTSIATALIDVKGSRRFGGNKHITPPMFAKTLRGRFDPRLKSYQRFCFVRDPRDRFVSLHRYLLGRDATTKIPPKDVNEFAAMLGDGVEWVLKMHSIRPQVDYARGLDHVGKFESLAEDFRRICEAIGMPPPELPHHNASSPKAARPTGLTAESIAIIERHYADDFQVFGYPLMEG